MKFTLHAQDVEVFQSGRLHFSWPEGQGGLKLSFDSNQSFWMKWSLLIICV